MKHLILLSSLMFLFFSCGSDDRISNNDNGITKNYFPQHLDNQWNYNGSINTYFDGTAVANGANFNVFKNHSPVFGFTGDSYVRKEGNDYFVNATFSLDGITNIAIENKKFLDEGTEVGNEINNITSTENLTPTPINDGTFSGTVTPNISIRSKIFITDHYDSITLNGSSNYNDVIKVVWTYYLASDIFINGNYGILSITNQGFPLINEQEVGTLEQYFANDIGLVRSTFDIDISNVVVNQSINFSGAVIPISSYIVGLNNSISNSTPTHSVSELDTYTVIN